MKRTLALVLLGMVALMAGFAAVPTATAGCHPHCPDGGNDGPCLDLLRTAPVGPDPDNPDGD